MTAATNREQERRHDAGLVLAAAAGDAQAAASLVRRWHRRLTAHAIRLTGNPDRAADIVQESWADIFAGLPRLQDPEAFPAWAYRIVSRRAARAIAGLQHDRRLQGALDSEPPPAVDAEPSDSLAITRLRAAIRTLPADQRAAIALFHFEGLGVAEVAVALDCPIGTVKTRLLHARRKLRAQLTPEGEI